MKRRLILNTAMMGASLAVVVAFIVGSGQSTAGTLENTPTGKVLQDTAVGRQSADKTFDGRADVPPVEVNKSSSTRTAEQAIKEFKDSGQAQPGSNTLKTPEPPSPRKK
jgi:hypothetical protein